MTEAEDLVVTKLAKTITSPMVSYRFYSRGRGAKVYIFARSKNEAWRLLKDLVRVGACKDFSLDWVEIPIRLWEDEN